MIGRVLLYSTSQPKYCGTGPGSRRREGEMGDRRRATTQALDRSSVRPTGRKNEQQNTSLPSSPSLCPLPARTPDLGLYCTNFCPRSFARSLNRRSPIGFGRRSLTRRLELRGYIQCGGDVTSRQSNFNGKRGIPCEQTSTSFLPPKGFAAKKMRSRKTQKLYS